MKRFYVVREFVDGRYVWTLRDKDNPHASRSYPSREEAAEAAKRQNERA